MAGLGETLVEQGVLQPEQLQHATEHAGEGGSLARALVELGYAEERDLVRAFAGSLGMPFAEVDAGSVDPHAASLLPADVARSLVALPVAFGDGDRVRVAVADPNSPGLVEQLQEEIGLRVELALSPRRALIEAIEQHAANQVPTGVGAGTAATVPPPPVTQLPPPPSRGPSAEAPAPPAPDDRTGPSPTAATTDPPSPDSSSLPPRPSANVRANDDLGGGGGQRLRSEEESEVDLDALLKELVERGGSDLHLTAGIPPTIRVDGDLMPMDDQPVMMPDELQKMLYAIMTQKQREAFENELELDLSYAVPNLARFRVNVFQQRDSMGSVMRVIPFDILPLEDLGVPEQVANFAYLPRGFVLVTGPTGSGKSTTLASLVDLVNRNRPSHIMTVEDPIEFLHKHKRSVVNQREVGTDTHGFNEALKHVLRQDPDVILVGELRDLETIQIALTAAETGHLVFATLHTQDAPQTIDRVVDVFPPHQQEQIRVMLAGALRGVVCQTLLKTADGKGRTVACEVMIATSGIRNLIREGKTHQIYSAIQAG
ncbi:MAG: PilT/PilU family type 4a pilus ATPase, partial [Nitriliruptor sp.]|uniref:PilT/PilU family type 4a pilus ATPase n=1 Tax=Nitriliruptor sp. TaxID=2448056 RepID=UPI00349FF57F